MPGKVPRLLLVGVFTALGAWSHWIAFDPDSSWPMAAELAVSVGLVCLLLAWRALGQWRSLRGR